MSQSTKPGIAKSWTLIAFKADYDHMKITPEFTNTETGETFKSLAFYNDDDRENMILVGFSESCGIDSSLSDAKIVSALRQTKDNLQIVKLKSGSYKLCKQGTDTWTEVEL